MRHHSWTAGAALLWIGAALASVGSCQGASREELLAGKACDAGACAKGYVCDQASNLCVPESSLDGGGGATSGGGGSAGSGGEGGSPQPCVGPEDCPGNENACESRSCDSGQCGQTFSAKGSDCNFDGGDTCDGSGHCVPATCIDGVLDGDETDLDCGGSCAPCANGLGCVNAEDCVSSFCDGAGGSGAGVCAACTTSVDCAATLAPSYCDAGNCVPTKGDGDPCGADEQCVSGHCPTQDGLCCDTACNDVCEACTAAKSGGSDGVCALITGGADPDGECPATSASTCGSTGMGCSGNANACILHDASTVCTPASCAAGSAQPAALCDGQGACVTQASVNCAPYACDAMAVACLSDCSAGGDADCIGSHYCASNQCVAKKPLGAVCGAPNECQSAICADGVCCDAACGGSCEACVGTKTAATSGTCAPITAGSDPDNECGAGLYCDGMGGCAAKPLGASCTLGSECQSAICADGVCCDSACGGNCMACHVALTGQPSGTCLAIPSGLDPQNECGATQVCNGAGQCKRVDGAVCNNSGQCLSGDCCQSDCSSGWQNSCLPASCSNAGQDGSESAVDCGGPICRKCAGGLSCGINNDCISNNCQGSVCL